VTVLVAVGCGALGLLVGAFLDVVADRVPRREPVVGPGSLLVRDSPRYPAIHVATALVFAAVGARFGAAWALPAYLVLAAGLVAVSAVDLERFLVPNRILLATLAAGVPLLLLADLLDGTGHDVAMAAAGGALAFALLLVINLVVPKGMGMGDVKLAGVLGLWLGSLDLGHVFLGLFLGFLLGSVVGGLLIVLGRRGRRDHIPFAPFLAAGALAAILVGGPFLDWYGG
jgi:leader peptidase (prepilin peptidase)/N-methyltransferase